MTWLALRSPFTSKRIASTVPATFASRLTGSEIVSSGGIACASWGSAFTCARASGPTVTARLSGMAPVSIVPWRINGPTWPEISILLLAEGREGQRDVEGRPHREIVDVEVDRVYGYRRTTALLVLVIDLAVLDREAPN